MRAEAIDLLMELYRTASSEAEKRRTEATLFEATRTPNGSAYSNELLVSILEKQRVHRRRRRRGDGRRVLALGFQAGAIVVFPGRS
jgi:hypothetical protein